MKLFRRTATQQRNAAIVDAPFIEPQGQREPEGHIHPNYRYLSWLRHSKVNEG